MTLCFSLFLTTFASFVASSADFSFLTQSAVLSKGEMDKLTGGLSYGSTKRNPLRLETNQLTPSYFSPEHMQQIQQQTQYEQQLRVQAEQLRLQQAQIQQAQLQQVQLQQARWQQAQQLQQTQLQQAQQNAQLQQAQPQYLSPQQLQFLQQQSWQNAAWQSAMAQEQLRQSQFAQQKQELEKQIEDLKNQLQAQQEVTTSNADKRKTRIFVEEFGEIDPRLPMNFDHFNWNLPAGSEAENVPSYRSTQQFRWPKCEGLPPVSISVLQQHSTAEDCWIAIHGKVYDFSKYLPSHPNGGYHLQPWCGKDGTKAFDTEVHAHVSEDELRRTVGKCEGPLEQRGFRSFPQPVLPSYLRSSAEVSKSQPEVEQISSGANLASGFRGVMLFDMDGTLSTGTQKSAAVHMALKNGFAVGINTAGGSGYSPEKLCQGAKSLSQLIPDNLCEFMAPRGFDTFFNVNGNHPILGGQHFSSSSDPYKTATGPGSAGKMKGYAMKVAMDNLGISHANCVIQFDDDAQYLAGIKAFNGDFQTFHVASAGNPKFSPEAIQLALQQSACPLTAASPSKTMRSIQQQGTGRDVPNYRNSDNRTDQQQFSWRIRWNDSLAQCQCDSNGIIRPIPAFVRPLADCIEISSDQQVRDSLCNHLPFPSYFYRCTSDYCR